jgi:hypothetical protein
MAKQQKVMRGQVEQTKGTAEFRGQNAFHDSSTQLEVKASWPSPHYKNKEPATHHKGIISAGKEYCIGNLV